MWLKPTVAIMTMLAGPAIAADVTAQNPQGIVDTMQGAGYKATLGRDDMGDPKIESSASGVAFTVFFYGCTNGADCQSIQFSSGFDLDDGASLAKINDWNAAERFTNVYLDEENDPFLEMDVNLGGAGMPLELFAANLATWDDASGRFQRHIDW